MYPMGVIVASVFWVQFRIIQRYNVLLFVVYYHHIFQGDGVKMFNEQCDDGNLITKDGCNELCKIE